MKKKRVKSFEAFNHTIKVIYRPNVLHPDGTEVMGLFIPLRNEIHVSTVYGNEKLTEEVIQHSFHHERNHCKMILLNEWDLNSNEPFIDQCGGLDAQYEKTAKY